LKLVAGIITVNKKAGSPAESVDIRMRMRQRFHANRTLGGRDRP
jgi:hypothetical protein